MLDQLLDKDVPYISFKHLTNPMKAFTQNAQHLEPNSALCKVFANEIFYIVRFDVSHYLIFLLMSHNLAIFFYTVRFDVSHYVIFLLMAHIYFYFFSPHCLQIYLVRLAAFGRCCVKGSLLEVNDRLIKQPGLLNSSVSLNFLCIFSCQNFWISNIHINCYTIAHQNFFST